MDEQTPAELQDRLVEDILNRFVKMVLFARIGDGTWEQDEELTKFYVELPDEDDEEFRVQTNDDPRFWSAPRLARDAVDGDMIGPGDVVVKEVPPPSAPAQRYIRGELTPEGWQLDVSLNRPHPRRTEHLAAAREFIAEAAGALERENIRSFYESAFHGAEHLAQAELLAYAPAAREIDSAKTHQTVRSTYALWGRLGNTDARFAKLLVTLGKVRQTATYLKPGDSLDADEAVAALGVLQEMLEWVSGVVDGRDGPTTLHLVATQDIEGGQLVGVDDVALRPPRGDKRKRSS